MTEGYDIGYMEQQIETLEEEKCELLGIIQEKDKVKEE